MSSHSGMRGSGAASGRKNEQVFAVRADDTLALLVTSIVAAVVVVDVYIVLPILLGRIRPVRILIVD